MHDVAFQRLLLLEFFLRRSHRVTDSHVCYRILKRHPVGRSRRPMVNLVGDYTQSSSPAVHTLSGFECIPHHVLQKEFGTSNSRTSAVETNP